MQTLDVIHTKSKEATHFGEVKYVATFRRIRMTPEDYEKLYPPPPKPVLPESSSYEVV